MLKLEPHPEYKDSGVEWLGEIPKTWDALRSKYVVRENKELSTTGEEELLSVSQYTGVTRKIENTDNSHKSRVKTKVGYKLVRESDLVTNIMLAWNGSLGVSPCDGVVSPAYAVYRFKSGFFPRYYHYLLRTPLYKSIYRVESTGIIESRLRLYTDNFYRIHLLVPGFEEQKQIAAFLDAKTSPISKYIESKQNLIQLLAEQKQKIINHAVTRGLNPCVKCKPSGVEWLDDIPKKWKINQLRRIIKKGTSITYGIVQAGPDIKDGIPYIRTSDMKGSTLPHTGYLRTSEFIDSAYKRSKVEINDLVVAIRATLGKALLVPDYLEGANLTQGTAKVAPGELILPNYLSYQFNSPFVQNQIKRVAKGTTYKEITLDALRRIFVCIPSIIEQESIIKYISAKDAIISNLINRNKKLISKITELQTVIISDAVTGNINMGGQNAN